MNLVTPENISFRVSVVGDRIESLYEEDQFRDENLGLSRSSDKKETASSFFF